MKCLRLSLAAGLLTIVLATSAFAGDMPLPGVRSSAPTPSVAGDMPLPGVAAIDPVTEIALNIAQSLLSLF
jgi:hypothetical protein